MTAPTMPKGCPTAARAPTRAEGIESGLRRIQRSLLSPGRECADLFRRGGGAWFKVALEASRTPPRRQELLRDDECGRSARERLARDLRMVPTVETLEGISSRLGALLEEAPDRAQVRLLVGLLIDAFPNARPHSPEAFFETLALQIELDGHAPTIVAGASQELLRTKTFLPSIAEVLEACDRERQRQLANVSALVRAAAGRRALDQAAEALTAFDAGERYAPPPIGAAGSAADGRGRGRQRAPAGS